MVWLYIGIILCMRVVQSVFSKQAANHVPSNMIGYIKYTVFYQGMAAVLALVLFLIGQIGGEATPEIGATLLYATVSGIALAICCMCSLYALGTGTMVLNSIFGTAGLLIPTIASMILYDEVLQIWQWLGIAVFIVGAYLLIGNSKSIYGKFTWKTFLVLMLSLITNGLTMFMQKMFGMNIADGNVSLFSFGSFASGVVVLLVVLVNLSQYAARQRTPAKQPTQTGEFTFLPMHPEDTRLPKQLFLYGSLLAIAVFIINQFATMATPLISAVVLFALINGGATVISAIVGAVMFREKLSLQTIIGVLLSIGALVVIQIS